MNNQPEKALEYDVDEENAALEDHVDEENAALEDHVDKENAALEDHVDKENAALEDDVDEENAALEDDVDEEKDSVLVIIPNIVWVNLHGAMAYNTIMDTFATTGLINRRRDRNSHRIFFFKEYADLYTLRDQIKINNLAPTAFCVSPDALRNHQINSNAQQVPVGEAWIIAKTGVNSSDFVEDRHFFYF